MKRRPGLAKIAGLFVIFGAITVGLGYINIWLGVIAMLILVPVSAEFFQGR